MSDWLVITADRTQAGRGVRGQTLARFLRTYFGRRHVAVLTPDEWRKSPCAAKTAFLGLPSSLLPDEIERLGRIEPRSRLVLFDYLDQHELAWTAEQEPVLRELTDRYFKPWSEPAWNYGLRMGLLPIRRYGRFTAALMLDRTLRRLGVRPQPRYDIAFLGRPNRTRMIVDGQVQKTDARVQWLRELKQQAAEFSLWGGLVDTNHAEMAEIEAEHGDVSDLLYAGSKVNFPAYYRALRHSRVLLAPGGNVPWTYRHYECLYAGGVVVTVDYRQRDMLVPLPRENMVHVPDGASVIPAIREALELSRRRPTIGEENFTHLERYLRFGAYSRTRPALLERFLRQLQ